MSEKLPKLPPSEPNKGRGPEGPWRLTRPTKPADSPEIIKARELAGKQAREADDHQAQLIKEGIAHARKREEAQSPDFAERSIGMSAALDETLSKSGVPRMENINSVAWTFPSIEYAIAQISGLIKQTNPDHVSDASYLFRLREQLMTFRTKHFAQEVVAREKAEAAPKTWPDKIRHGLAAFWEETKKGSWSRILRNRDNP